ncbi:MAG: hypothetical protein AAGD01_09155 [Acidobacteriota bacterium]
MTSPRTLLSALLAAFFALTLSLTSPSPATAQSADGAASADAGSSLELLRSAERRAGAPIYLQRVLSQLYSVDSIYRSMQGPWSQESVVLGDALHHQGLKEGSAAELLWVVGYRAAMVAADGESARSQEFMCHSNLDLNAADHRSRFGAQKVTDGRLFTLSQGQYTIDLPEGFGIPLLSDEPLSLTTQVLNLNLPEPRGLDVRHRVEIQFVRDADLKRPMQALFPQGIYGLATLEDQPVVFGREASPTSSAGHLLGAAASIAKPEEGSDSAGHHGGDHSSHGSHEGHGDAHGGAHGGAADVEAMMAAGATCMVGQNAATHEYQDRLGRRFTGHWVVQPGREVNRTLVTDILTLPFDTRVHYIAVHLHPFAESLELRNLTTGKTVFKSRVRPADAGIGIEHVEYFSSVEGVELFREHEYEMVSIYENSSGEPQDSMAVMYLYLLDREYQRPAELTVAGR